MRIGDVDSRKDVVEGPKVLDWFSAMSHDNQSPLAAEVVEQQLEESVDCECLSV